KADMELSCSSNCEYDEDDEILYLGGNKELNEKFSISITVTSYDGDNMKKYTLDLVRSYSDALLEGLAVNTSESSAKKGQLLLDAEDFEADQFSYTLQLENSSEIDSLFLWIDTESANDVWVNGERAKSKNRQPYELELDEIEDEIELKIEDEDPLNSAVYTLKLEQGTENTAKGALDSLYVSKSKNTSSSKTLNLYPEFDPDQGSYHVFLADGMDEIYVLAEASQRKALVYYNYKAGVTKEEDDMNDEWFTFSGIKEGSILSIQVVDEDGDLLGSYSLTFHCGKGSDNNDKDLDDLFVSNQTGESKYERLKLDKDFSFDEEEYSVDVPANSYNNIRIYAEAFDNKAFVLVDGELVGKDGYVERSCQDGKSYTYEITVIAANCDDNSSYQLTVNYGEIKGSSTGAFLSGLSAKVYGGASLNLSPVFEDKKMNYTANVSNSVSYISFRPIISSGSGQIELFGYVQENGKWTNYYQMNEGINNIPIYVYEGDNKEAANTYYVTVYRQPAKLSTVVSSQKLTIDGNAVQLNAYNINGNNFVKLRDIAYLLNGSPKQFQVGFVASSNSIYITSGSAYTSNGQENVSLNAPKRAAASSQTVYLNSALVAPMAYNIDGNNYLMLRDLALLLDFGMTYDANSGTVAISTTNTYSPDK
ncbi:MAG: cadherin-like beta sandwich domain-containing protein, partial [Bacillota bacterium]|nr:cadherin-like beta sandwich domain-containing protein [Bacillota bacterium]